MGLSLPEMRSPLVVDVYERTLTVDGEDTTLVVMDTWEAEKLVWHCKQGWEEGC
jgi:hypothetical protein